MSVILYRHAFYASYGPQTASKELGIVCFTDRNFLTAMIPVPRREIHLKKYVFVLLCNTVTDVAHRLLSQGHKVCTRILFSLIPAIIVCRSVL